jgi:hypothetical protein
MRDRFISFIDRHEIAWELGMGFLAIFYVAVGFALRRSNGEYDFRACAARDRADGETAEEFETLKARLLV